MYNLNNTLSSIPSFNNRTQSFSNDTLDNVRPSANAIDLTGLDLGDIYSQQNLTDVIFPGMGQTNPDTVFNQQNLAGLVFPGVGTTNPDTVFAQQNLANTIFPGVGSSTLDTVFNQQNLTNLVFPGLGATTADDVLTQQNLASTIFPGVGTSTLDTVFNQPNLIDLVFPGAGTGISPNFAGVVNVAEYDTNHLPTITNPVIYETKDPINASLYDLILSETTVPVTPNFPEIPEILKDMNPIVTPTPIIPTIPTTPTTPTTPDDDTPVVIGNAIPVAANDVPTRVVNTAGGFNNVSMQGQAYRSSSIPQLYGFSGIANNQQEAQTLIAYIEQMYAADPDFKNTIDMLINKYGFASATASDLEGNTIGRATINGNEIIIDVPHIRTAASSDVKHTIAHEFGHSMGYNHDAAHEAFIERQIDGV